MRTVVNIFTAASLIIHAMIGCCHSHWHDETCQAVEVNLPTCSCCHHGDATQDSSSLPTPCNGEHECQGVCCYLPTLKPTIDDAGMHTDFTPVFVLLHEIDCTRGNLESYRELPDLGASPPHLRLHLLHRMLLI